MIHAVLAASELHRSHGLNKSHQKPNVSVARTVLHHNQEEKCYKEINIFK
jgi:hypothetical protein